MTQNVRWYARRGDIKRLFDEDQHVFSVWTFESPVQIAEMEDFVGAPDEGLGSVWVKSGDPNTLWFTDDEGNDWLIGGSGAGGDGTFPFVPEAIAAAADQTGFGQIWVKTTASVGMVNDFATLAPITNSLWYTDDGGHDVPLVGDAYPLLQSVWVFNNVTRFNEALDVAFSVANPGSGCVLLNARTSDPSATADACTLYAKGADPKLYCRDADGTITQLTF